MEEYTEKQRMEGYIDFSVEEQEAKNIYRLLRKKMEEYTEKQRMEGYIDFSVEKENGRVYREAKNGRVYRLLCGRERIQRWKRSKEWKGI